MSNWRGDTRLGVIPAWKAARRPARELLYSVRADNGLGGLALGRGAADELAAKLIGRPDVVSVEVEPMPSTYAETTP